MRLPQSLPLIFSVLLGDKCPMSSKYCGTVRTKPGTLVMKIKVKKQTLNAIFCGVDISLEIISLVLINDQIGVGDGRIKISKGFAC